MNFHKGPCLLRESWLPTRYKTTLRNLCLQYHIRYRWSRRELDSSVDGSRPHVPISTDQIGKRAYNLYPYLLVWRPRDPVLREWAAVAFMRRG